VIFIVDLDGTVADITHRLHFIGATETKYVPYKDTKDWEGFHNACVDDAPIWTVITVVRALAKAGHTIVYSTGRGEQSRLLTMQWLEKYRVPFSTVYMRKQGDHREDYVVKGEFLDQILAHYKVTEKELGGAFEDRQQVVKMYRGRGVKVFQVADGNF
jgi:hypothetical protein